MASKLKVVWSLIAIVILGCASSPRFLLLDVHMGMSKDQVLDILGEPASRSSQEPYQAWRYEYKYLSQTKCTYATPNRILMCSSECLYGTVWFNNNVVRALTGIRSDSLKECESGSIPVDWNHMPESVKRPDG